MDTYYATVMVVEDEEPLLKAITKKLGLHNIETISCSSGRQAIDYLSQIPKLPDAIWLDYYLKDTDGVEFMKSFNAHENWQAIPVFVVSNSASHEKVQTMFNMGVKKYFLKSQYRLEDIVNKIAEYIHNDNTHEP